MTEPIDYAALQKELSERDGCRVCENCVEVDESFINPEILRNVREHGFVLYDWTQRPWLCTFVHYCKPCAAHNFGQPHSWIADIAPERFVAWMQSHDYAFLLDSMRCLLPCTHPMFEKPPLGPTKPCPYCGGANCNMVCSGSTGTPDRGGFEFL